MSISPACRLYLVTLVALLISLAGCEQGEVSLAASPAPPAQPAEDQSADAPPAPGEPHDDEPEGQAGEDPEPREDPVVPEDDVRQDPFPAARPSPSLEGGVEWLNTAGPLDLKDLRGKWVVLDFWTYCCINCMHVLPELKKLEKAYPNTVVVIGVHSAKFETEKVSQNIREAILRYEIEHPVVNDANHAIWDRFRVSSWPSLRIIDPQGRLVAGDSGEIPFEAFKSFLDKVTPYYKRKGALDEQPLRFDLESHKTKATPLRFPGKVLADEAGDRLFITDSNHNRIVVCRNDGTLLEVIGEGPVGDRDGDYKSARFDHPQGLALDGDTLYVADTENHLLRKVDLKQKRVTTIAGTGEQARTAWPGMERDENGVVQLPARFVGKPKETGINSPWALWVHDDDLYIAMAGPHQIWKMPLDESEIGPYAGNGREDIVDGPLLPEQPYALGFSSFAQPSGLASDGQWLYVADSEGSSVRAVPFEPAAGEVVDRRAPVRTVVGTADLPHSRLFTFGDTDGAWKNALLQHCLGVSFYDGKLYVADTYNNKIKVLDFKRRTIRTIAGTGKPGAADRPATFDEPAGLAAAGGKLYVADTNNHLIRVIDLKNGNRVSTLKIEGLAPPEPPEEPSKPSFAGAAERALPATAVKPVDGKITFRVRLALQRGWKINPLAPMSYYLEAEGDAGPLDRAALGKIIRTKQRETELEFRVPVTAAEGTDTLKVALTYYYCRTGAEGLCKVGSVVWTVPLELSASAKDSTVLLKHAVK